MKAVVTPAIPWYGVTEILHRKHTDTGGNTLRFEPAKVLEMFASFLVTIWTKSQLKWGFQSLIPQIQTRVSIIP